MYYKSFRALMALVLGCALNANSAVASIVTDESQIADKTASVRALTNTEPEELFPLDIFPTDLNELQFCRQIGGGSGGVVVLKNNQGMKFTLKAAKHTDQIKEEILTDALYRAFGVPVPAFVVFDRLPKRLAKQMQLNHQEGPFRLAQFIEEDKTLIPSREMLNRFALVDGFLSNHDRKGAQWDNVILDPKGMLWRIDNGGGLRFTATGKKKEICDQWNPYWLSELHTMIADQIDTEEMSSQFDNFYERLPRALEVMRELGSALKVTDLDELESALVSRSRYLLMPQPMAYAYERAIPEMTSASILIHNEIDGVPCVLMGKRVGTGLWGNLGGGSERRDIFLNDSAAREGEEESFGLVKISSSTLFHQPSHDLLTKKANSAYTRHRMYFHPYKVDVGQLNDNNGRIEHTEFKWVPVSVLVKALQEAERVKRAPSSSTTAEESTIVVDEMVIHPPFYHMLIQPGVYTQLLNLVKRKPLFRQHTQGWLKESEPGQVWPIAPTGHPVHWVDNKTRRIMDTDTVPITSSAEQARELAKTVADRAQVLAQIKNVDAAKVRQNFDHEFQDNRMAGIRKNLATNEYEFDEQAEVLPAISRARTHKVGSLEKEKQPQPHELLQDKAVSQTQAYLMNQQEGYDENNSLAENAMAFMDEHFKLPHMRAEPVLQQVVRMLDNEQAHRQQFLAFYTATISEIGFLTEVMTEARNQLEGTQDPDFKLLRGQDAAFICENVMGFLKRQGQIQDELSAKHIFKAVDYTPGYQDQAVSASSSLFGAHSLEKESAMHYFMHRQSIAPPPLDLMIRKFFKQFGLRIDPKTYEALYEEFFEPESGGDKTKRSNTAMMQIFMCPDLAEHMTYNSGTGGGLVEYLVRGDYCPKQSILQLLDDPKGANRNQVHNHQVKIWQDPKVVHNTDMIRIKQYWQKPLSEARMAEFRARLVAMIRNDLVQAMSSKVANRAHTYRSPSALGNGTLSPTEKVYELAHENILDLPVIYKPAEATHQDLNEALMAGDYNEFYQLFPRWEEPSQEQLNQLCTLAVQALRSGVGQDAVDVIKFLIAQGKVVTQAEITQFVEMIESKTISEQMYPIPLEHGISVMKLMLEQVKGVSSNALYEAAVKVQSVELTTMMLEKAIPDACGGPIIDVILDNIIVLVNDLPTRLELLKIVATKFKERLSDGFLHLVLARKDWDVVEVLAQVDLDRLFTLSVRRLQEPTLEWAREILGERHEFDQDDTVDPASYAQMRKLLALKPSDEAIDQAIAGAIWCFRHMALKDLLHHKPKSSPETDATVKKMLSSNYEGEMVFRSAISWHENLLTQLFLDHMDWVSQSYAFLSIECRNHTALSQMLERKMDLVGPLSRAILCQDLEAIRLIRSKMTERIPSYVRRDAVASYNPAIMEIMEEGATPEDLGQMLIEASYCGYKWALTRYLNNPSTSPEFLGSALGWAIWNEKKGQDLCQEIYQKMLELRDQGADINVESPILACIDESNFEFLKRIVADFKPDLNFCEFGISPLSKAVINAEFEMVAFLLENGADPNYFKRWYYSPLFWAVKRQLWGGIHIQAYRTFFRLLQDKFGADYEYNLYDEGCFLSYKSCPRESNEIGREIFEVVQAMNLRLVEMLLNAGANPQPERIFEPDPEDDISDGELLAGAENSDKAVGFPFDRKRKKKSAEIREFELRQKSPLYAAKEYHLKPIYQLLKSRIKPTALTIEDGAE